MSGSGEQLGRLRWSERVPGATSTRHCPLSAACFCNKSFSLNQFQIIYPALGGYRLHREQSRRFGGMNPLLMTLRELTASGYWYNKIYIGKKQLAGWEQIFGVAFG